MAIQPSVSLLTYPVGIQIVWADAEAPSSPFFGLAGCAIFPSPSNQEMSTPRVSLRAFLKFSHIQRENMRLYQVCFCQHSLPLIDIPFPARITNRTRLIENISGVFPHLERRIYTSCLFQPANSSYDRYSLSSKNYEPHAFCRKHFW